MTENIKRLLELASANEELQTKLTKANKEELIAIAKENGFELTDADFEAPKGEIGDDELNAVSGGKSCSCVLGGGGTGSSSLGSKTCACVVAGVGKMNDNNARCLCPLAGTGEDHRY